MTYEQLRAWALLTGNYHPESKMTLVDIILDLARKDGHGYAMTGLAHRFAEYIERERQRDNGTG